MSDQFGIATELLARQGVALDRRSSIIDPKNENLQCLLDVWKKGSSYFHQCGRADLCPVNNLSIDNGRLMHVKGMPDFVFHAMMALLKTAGGVEPALIEGANSSGDTPTNWGSFTSPVQQALEHTSWAATEATGAPMIDAGEEGTAATSYSGLGDEWPSASHHHHPMSGAHDNSMLLPQPSMADVGTPQFGLISNSGHAMAKANTVADLNDLLERRSSVDPYPQQAQWEGQAGPSNLPQRISLRMGILQDNTDIMPVRTHGGCRELRSNPEGLMHKHIPAFEIQITPQERGKRRGPLSQVSKVHARDVRRAGGPCDDCKVRKVKCRHILEADQAATAAQAWHAAALSHLGDGAATQNLPQDFEDEDEIGGEED